MEEVRNCCNKLVCQIDMASRIVEILIKGCKTTIRFNDDGEVEIHNSKVV